MDGAEEAFRAASVVDPSDPQNYLNLGVLLEEERKDLLGAEKAYLAAIQVIPLRSKHRYSSSFPLLPRDSRAHRLPAIPSTCVHSSHSSSLTNLMPRRIRGAPMRTTSSVCFCRDKMTLQGPNRPSAQRLRQIRRMLIHKFISASFFSTSARTGTAQRQLTAWQSKHIQRMPRRGSNT